MSKEEKLQLENECLMKYSKAQMIQKYIDELDESSKLSELWCKSQEENRKLEDNWNKLKEHIKSEWTCFDNESVEFEVSTDILDKMQEIEGSDE